MKFSITLLSLVIVASLLFTSCGGKDDECETCGCPTCDDFEKDSMLINYADSLIIPSYTTLNKKLTTLTASYNSFSASADAPTLTQLQTDFLEAYKAYQYCTPYDFGPALGAYSLEAMNVYPTNTTTIESNIQTGTYDLESGLNFDANGFPAIDYLLYANDDDNAVLTMFTSDSLATMRMTLLGDIIIQITERVDYILGQWNDNYRANFVGSLGTDPSSSIALFINKYNEAFEEAKNFKVGIPSGRKSLSGDNFPDKVESLHGGHSLILLTTQLDALEKAFTGNSYTYDSTGLGLDDHLVAYENADLVTSINTKYETAALKLDEINTSIDTEIKNGSDVVGELYDILQSTVVYLKSDMPSILSVGITYQDGDGD